MRDFVINKFYQPVLFFFLLPIFYIALGSIFSLQYNGLNYFPLVIFYLFIFINQMLENMFLRIPKEAFQISKRFVIILEVLTALIILFFGVRHSWIASFVLLGFTLIIQLQFLFSYYDLDYISVIITTFFKLILLNGFAFYIGTNFIHSRFIPYYFGLFLPFYLYEASRVSSKTKNKTTIVLIGIGYLLGIVLLWQHLAWVSLLLFISLPFAWFFVTEYSRKTATIYTITFSIVYLSLITYAFLT